jgi:predicted nucleic acid-binding protein
MEIGYHGVMTQLRAVIDTNVVFEGLTGRGGATGAILDAWETELFRPCFSHKLAYEYADVLARKLAAARWERVRPVLDALLNQAELVTIHYSWRPSSPDPGDEHIIDCAMNARAGLVTSNVRDFKLARGSLGLHVLTPVEFMSLLINNPQPSA